jgi:hypothetical protein
VIASVYGLMATPNDLIDVYALCRGIQFDDLTHVERFALTEAISQSRYYDVVVAVSNGRIYAIDPQGSTTEKTDAK